MNYKYLLKVLSESMEMFSDRDQVEISCMVQYFRKKGFLPKRKQEQLALIFERINTHRRSDNWDEAQKKFGL